VIQEAEDGDHCPL